MKLTFYAILAAMAAFTPPALAATTNVSGMVTFWHGGIDYAFMKTGDGHGVRLGLRQGQSADPGELVDATGMLTVGPPSIRMEDVALHKKGRWLGLLPRQTATVAGLYAPPSADSAEPGPFALPVTMTCRVLDVNRRRTQVQLLLSDLGSSTPAAPASFPLPDGATFDSDLRRGAVVRIKAVPSMWYSEKGVENLTLNIRGAYDVEVLSRPPWWTTARIWTAAGFALLALVAAIGWAAAMTASLRRERHATAAIASERRRMAADLHDTIEQHLAGVKILLAAATEPCGIPPETLSLISRAEDMLVYAKGEVRSAVMNLRGDEEGMTIDEALKCIAAPEGVRVRTKLRTGRAGLDPSLLRNLLMIVREAVTNAVKHGRAKNVVIATDPLPRGGFALRVLNDGEPFDRKSALGPETGHYGLAGMEERADKCGFGISFGKLRRWTFVRLEVGK